MTPARFRECHVEHRPTTAAGKPAARAWCIVEDGGRVIERYRLEAAARHIAGNYNRARAARAALREAAHDPR